LPRSRIIPDPAERAYLGVRLARLLGVSFPEDGGAALSREELFAGWRLFFERLAAVHPVVLLVEDAQHADGGLLDFLDHLIDWMRDLPVYVAVFARPELGLTRPGFGAGRNRITLTLDPLDAVSMDQLVDTLVPGMPPAARAKITGHAQGVPLFAVETVRSLIDRDIVQPVKGVYRLTGDIGELAIPDSLHALLAARLDALDPAARKLVADAAVLGTSFPAEALIAVSGRDEPEVRAALADLVRREVLSVSADPLSPERGSYQFAQQILRQVAYATLSRRDRKTRHLAVAAHLRAAFAGDGEEVADVIARHYLDALNAIPGDPDAAQIRAQAITALVRAAERAERTGAPARAATSYAAAAELSSADTAAAPGTEGSGRQPSAGLLWEHAAEAAVADATWATALEHADRARRFYSQCGQDRAAARAQAVAGNALRHWGRHAEARDQLSTAMNILRADPDTDTIRALTELAGLEVSAGSAEADRLTAEALTLGQALDVGARQMSILFVLRGIYHDYSGRRLQAVAYFREGARLATQAGDDLGVARALFNLSAALCDTDPLASAEASRTAVGHVRRTGAREYLAWAILNLTEALLDLGDWDGAAAELAQAVNSDGLQDHEILACRRSWLAALRGDPVAAGALLNGMPDLRASEDPQDKALLSLAEAFTAVADGQLKDALRHARSALANIDAIGFGPLMWMWPLAARAAFDLHDTAATGELLALLDSRQPGHIPLMVRAERGLVNARLASRDSDPDAGAAFASAISSLRELSTPYHVAHGLLDHARHLTGHGDNDAATAAIQEDSQQHRLPAALPAPARPRRFHRDAQPASGPRSEHCSAPVQSVAGAS
jgi:tetratricopeptide (TPR) repeat protein